MAVNRQTLFLSHGGGPMPLLGDPGHQALVEQLEGMRTRLQKPEAIIVISAHWEDSTAAITCGAKPDLIYDYNGFPPQAYELQYPAPGLPELAEEVYRLLQNAGIPTALKGNRGFDHGMFVPLKILFPEADVPVIQVALFNHMDAEKHLELGRALSALQRDKVLVVGSGFSFHNMRAFFQSSPEADAHDAAFEGWLQETMCSAQLNEEQRWQRLAQWEKAPSARFCHPREEHLLPLMVCYGYTQRACDYYDVVEVLGKHAGLFYWQS